MTFPEPVPMTEQGRELIRKVLEACDQAAMDHLVFHLVASNAFTDADVERTMRQELAVASHEVQAYWLGECNCHGKLN